MKKPKRSADYNGKSGIPTPAQKRLLEASLDNTPQTPMKKLALIAKVRMQTVSLWFETQEFEHWWLFKHLRVNRTMYVEKIVRAICERAVRPSASAKDRELALQILSPEQLNKAKVVDRPQVVINFVEGARSIDMPTIAGRLPEEPRLVDYKGEGEEIIEAEVDVA